MALGKQTTGAAKKGKEERDPAGVSRPKPGVADYLASEASDFVDNLSPYLPQELVGGNLPYIPGTEDEAVWNAASQACATEKVHYCYSVDEDRLWFLACPSNSLSSNPDSWCPLAAALPGNSEYWDRETVYLYEQEGVASALRWDPETNRMQVFLGASRTILPRVQSMDANFVTINPDVADIVPWRNRSLKTEKLARATAKTLIMLGVLVTLCSAIVLAMSFVSVNLIERNLEIVQQETAEASAQLIRDANSSLQSDTIKHMVRVQEILDFIVKFDGTLVRYEVGKGKVEWEVLVPKPFVEPLRIEFRGTRVGEKNEADDRVRVIGTR